MVSGLKASAKFLRRDLRRARQRSRFGKLDAPILFGNSFPKSGTHLLTQVLAGFADLGPVVDSGLPAIVTFDGPTGKPRPVSAILNDLSRFKPGDVAYGHLHAFPEVIDTLCQDGIAPFFIMRDPRDVVVSHVFYVTDIAPNHVHHHYYKNTLTTFDERLRTSMLGRPELDNPFPDIRARFAPYLPWLSRPEVLTLHFEDFIADKDEPLTRIVRHAIARGFDYQGNEAEAVSVLGAKIAPKKSPTFRSGKVGGWRQHFTTEHKQLFKDITGDMLLTLGYEKDDNW